jgi:hypothetical protein
MADTGGSGDPSNPGSWNRYTYVLDDPVNLFDPEGLVTRDCPPGQVRIQNQGCLFVSTYELPGDLRRKRPYITVAEWDDVHGTGKPVPERKSSTDCDTNLTATFLDNYLKKKGSPIEGQGYDLIKWGREYDVDPRLLVALAGAETSFGVNITRGENNAWNWLWNKKEPSKSGFDTWDSAIKSVTKGLGNNYIHGAANQLTNTSAIYDKYCSGPDCKNGLKNLNTFLAELGGNRGGVAFPCK